MVIRVDKSSYPREASERLFKPETKHTLAVTWYDYSELGIPNRNNALEGQFADLKTKLRKLITMM
jgi:hypothetical protein